MPIIREQHAQWCVHYQRNPGDDPELCKVGVDYRELAQVEELGELGWGLRLPCIRSHHDAKVRKGEPLCECDKLRWPTDEECQKEERRYLEDLARMMAVFPIVKQVKEDHRGEDWAGAVDCPVCEGGDLLLSHAACNGHVHGRCSTEGCTSFME